jgi:uncharacterized membrane protein YhaH (DUF805 family)
MNIYKYTTADGRKTSIFILFMSLIVFFLVDFVAAAYVFDDPIFVLYSLLFRIILFIPYIFLASKAYYYFRYSGWMMMAISMPTFIWATLTFVKAFGLFYTLIIVVFFLLGMLEIKYREKQKEYDYKKSAKELLKEYPQPMSVKYKNLLDRYEKKRKKAAEENDRVISFIIRFIPPWSIFALPAIIGTISSMYLGFGGMVIGGMFASVILCLLFIGPTLDRYRYDYIFEEAQKILDGNDKK